MNISVVICTYNRYESLKDTLDSLLNQECDGRFDYEVIVVDNNSKDRTKEVVQSYMPKFNGRLKYVFEKNQGLSYARNRGIKEAKGEIIAFTDDDCLPEEEWIWKIWRRFNDDNKLDGILGNAIWDTGGEMYHSKDILRGSGLNMSFKKETLQKLGGFDINFGSGSIVGSAEDAEFVRRATKRNKNIIISEEIIVFHKHRLDFKEELKFAYRDYKGVTIFRLKCLFEERDIFFLKAIYWSILGLFESLFDGIKEKDRALIKFRLFQLTAAFTGLIKGTYIWLILMPFKSLCQKQVL